ncbi:hypothetical protein T261_1498 [Streptomyces lydicus]|nr:hypothetical protein T261_1498 [Streptomyces lydicus]
MLGPFQRGHRAVAVGHEGVPSPVREVAFTPPGGARSGKSSLVFVWMYVQISTRGFPPSTAAPEPWPRRRLATQPSSLERETPPSPYRCRHIRGVWEAAFPTLDTGRPDLRRWVNLSALQPRMGPTGPPFARPGQMPACRHAANKGAHTSPHGLQHHRGGGSTRLPRGRPPSDRPLPYG